MHAYKLRCACRARGEKEGGDAFTSANCQGHQVRAFQIGTCLDTCLSLAIITTGGPDPACLPACLTHISDVTCSQGVAQANTHAA